MMVLNSASPPHGLEIHLLKVLLLLVLLLILLFVRINGLMATFGEKVN